MRSRQNPTADAAPKRGCLRRIAVLSVEGALLALVAVIALFFGWLQSDDFQRRARAITERVVERETGEQLTLNRVAVGFFPPALYVDGLHLFHEPTGDTIASAERVRVPVVLRGGKPMLGRVTLQRPRFELHVEKDGTLREFRGRRQPTGPRKPLTELPFSSLDVRDGSLRLFFPDGAVAITHLGLDPLGGAVHDLSGVLTLQFRGYQEQTRLTLPNVQIGPERVIVPHLSLDTPTITAVGRADIPLQGQLDADLTAQLRLDALNAALTEPRRAHGFIDVDVELSGSTTAPELSLNAWGTHLAFDVPGALTPVLTYEVGDVSLAATARADRVEVEDLRLMWGGGEIRATGLVDPKARQLVDARVVADRVSLRRMLQAFDAAPTPWIDMLADAEVRASGPLDPLELSGDFDFAVADLKVGDRPVDAPGVQWMLDIPYAWARGALTVTKTGIAFTVPEVSGPRTRARAAIEIGFGPRGPLDVRAEVHHADLADFQPLNGVQLGGVGALGGRIHGPFNALRFDGWGDLSNFSVLGIPWADRLVATDFRSPDLKRIELEGAVATRGRTTYTGDFAFDFRTPLSMHTRIATTDGRIEDLVGIFLDLPGLSGGVSGTLALDGPINDMSGEAHFALDRPELWGERFEVGEAHGYMDAGLFTLDDLRVLRNDRREGLILRGSVGRAWALNMDLVADGFSVQTLDHLRDAALPVTGFVGGRVRVGNTLFDPAPRGELWMRDLRWDGSPAGDGRVAFSTSEGVLAFGGDLLGDAVDVAGTLGLWGDQPYAIQTRFTDLPAHLFHPRGADGREVIALATGHVDISGGLGAEWTPARIDGVVDDARLSWGPHALRNRTPWRYTQHGDAYTLEGFDLEGGRTAFRLGARGGGALELEGEGTVDLDLLRLFVPGLQRSEGVGRVALTVAGQRPNVEAVVDVHVDSELIRYDGIPIALEDLQAHIQLTETHHDVLGLTASLGGGTLTGGGRIDADSWLPSRYDLSFDVTDAAVKWIASLPPAIGSGAFRFDGPEGALLLSGDVRVDDMVFSDRVDWEDWVVEFRSSVLVGSAPVYDEDPAFSLDVQIGADRTIRLKNNVADATASADLRIIGDTSRPGLVGRVRVEDGIALIQDRQFRIDRGEVAWNDPWTWDPDVDFELITDIESRAQRYRVNYQVFGPFSNWRTASRSDPALPQADVNALLWFGVTTDDLEQTGDLSTALVQGMADLLLSDLFASTQASELGEVPDLLFDRIDVATGVNGRGEYSPEPRLVVQKRLPDLANVQLTWEFNLGRPEDNYVRVDRRVGGIWSISGWYATLQRDRVLPIGGAYGVDFTARWEGD